MTSFFLVFYPQNNFTLLLFLLIYLTFPLVKSVLIRGYSGLHFPAFGLNTERYRVFSPNAENEDQNKSEQGHLSRSVPSTTNMEIIARPWLVFQY